MNGQKALGTIWANSSTNSNQEIWNDLIEII